MQIRFNSDFKSKIFKDFYDFFFTLSVSGPDKTFNIKPYFKCNWIFYFETKERLSFTVSDIENFYPSISKNLFIKAIQLAKQMTEVFDEDINLIMHAKKNLLFNEGIPWLEKERMEDFNVPIDCFDGAEVCELVGSFILQQLSQLFEDQLVRLYRYDGLAIFKGLSGSETKRVKKKIIKVFTGTQTIILYTSIKALTIQKQFWGRYQINK